jgi:hypothetical protein
MMRDNKHYQAAKIDGFWDFVTRDPGDYQGRHALQNQKPNQVWMGCSTCRYSLKN